MPRATYTHSMPLTGSKDFKAGISITVPSRSASQMQEQLPSNYTRNKTSNTYAFLYGVGTEFDRVRDTFKQLEANNFLYSPSSQKGDYQVKSAGKYVLFFDVPFVIPPFNVSVSASDFTDVFIEDISRFAISITVNSDVTDIISWKASGHVGAVTDEILGDALYQNFGSLLNLPRLADSVVDESFVKQYEVAKLFISVESLIPVYDLVGFNNNNTVINHSKPPAGAIRGVLRPTTVRTNPTASHELVDSSGRILALLSFASSIFFDGPNNGLVRGPDYFYPTNLQSIYDPSGVLAAYDASQGSQSLGAYQVWIAGPQTTFSFNRWDQLAYRQEVFRADNKYRRILTGLNRAVKTGPNKDGVSIIMETILGQPHIPSDVWDASDFRIFENIINPSRIPLVQYQFITNTDGTQSINSVNATFIQGIFQSLFGNIIPTILTPVDKIMADVQKLEAGIIDPVLNFPNTILSQLTNQSGIVQQMANLLNNLVNSIPQTGAQQDTGITLVNQMFDTLNAYAESKLPPGAINNNLSNQNILVNNILANIRSTTGVQIPSNPQDASVGGTFTISPALSAIFAEQNPMILAPDSNRSADPSIQSDIDNRNIQNAANANAKNTTPAPRGSGINVLTDVPLRPRTIPYDGSKGTYHTSPKIDI